MSDERNAAPTRWIAIGAVVAAVAGGYGLYRLGMTRGAQMADHGDHTAASAPQKAGDVDPTTGKMVLYWHDPMVPSQRFEQPGKSPFMNMQLVPVYEGASDSAVEVSQRVRQNLGVRTAEVVRSTMTPRIEAAGNIAYDERDQVIVQARASAFVEKLYVRATLDDVRVGQALAELYVPAWVAVQEEFLSVLRMRGADTAVLVDAARQRMRQAGMTDAQARDVETSGAAQPRITLRAPIAGVVVELAAREGMTVMPGDTLFRINGLAKVWANAQVPEGQAGLLKPGATVEARSPAVPDVVFGGRLQAILPDVDATTRTIRARVELDNTARLLAPGMFVRVALAGAATDALMVPTEAVIETGTRSVVMRAQPNGTFQPVDVTVGIEFDGQTEIKSGLTAGEVVVVSGQFLLDSEASLRATSTRMEGATAPQTSTTHSGEGKIEALDADSVTLSHGPIASIQWGAMTMRFMLPADKPAENFAVGQSVRFNFVMDDDGKPRIVEIAPSGGGR